MRRRFSIVAKERALSKPDPAEPEAAAPLPAPNAG
jgi:hypothetical protein